MKTYTIYGTKVRSENYRRFCVIRFAWMNCMEAKQHRFDVINEAAAMINEAAAISVVEAAEAIFAMVWISFSQARQIGFKVYRYRDEKSAGVGPSVRFQFWRWRFGRFALWGRDKINPEPDGFAKLRAAAMATAEDDSEAHTCEHLGA